MLLNAQLLSAGAVVAFSMIMTFAIIKGMQFFTPVQFTESVVKRELYFLRFHELTLSRLTLGAVLGMGLGDILLVCLLAFAISHDIIF